MPLISCHQGDPSRPTCVFLHGFLGGKEDWQDMWMYFPQNSFCIAYDLPGHGGSPEISSHYLQVIEEEIASGASAKKILIGYSLGGRIALQLAEKNPSMYSHVVLLSAHPGLAKQIEKKARLETDLQWIDKLKRLPMDAFLKEWYEQSVFQSLQKHPDLLERIKERRMTQDPEKMADVLWMLSLSRQELLASFHPRTLFLYGEEDEKYQKYYSALPEDVSVHAIEQSGHAVHLENPEACSMRILQWLEDNP